MSAPRLLTDNDPQAVEIYNANAAAGSRILIICDHASNQVPENLNQLGIENPVDFNKHVAIDIGAAEISRYLADALDAPAVLAGFSRLVLDLNRAPDHPQSMPEASDGIQVPGNKGLSAEDRRQRLDEIYAPYHNTVGKMLDDIRARGDDPFLISIHSFTPQLGDEKRDTEIGILWDGNKEIAHHMIADLKQKNPGIKVDGNKPYSFIDDPDLNHSLRRHNIHHEKGYMLVEFRQDLVDSKDKAEAMAALFLDSLKAIL